MLNKLKRFVKFKLIVDSNDGEIETDAYIDLNAVKFYISHPTGRTVLSIDGEKIHILMPMDQFTKIMEYGQNTI
jgi:hypothetical protein